MISHPLTLDNYIKQHISHTPPSHVLQHEKARRRKAEVLQTSVVMCFRDMAGMSVIRINIIPISFYKEFIPFSDSFLQNALQ